MMTYRSKGFTERIELAPKYSIYKKTAKEAIESDCLEDYAETVLTLHCLSNDMLSGVSIATLVSVYGFEKVEWVLAAKANRYVFDEVISDWSRSVISNIPPKERTPYSGATEEFARKIPELIKEFYTLFIEKVSAWR